jgi:hypothetical protein
VEQRIKSNKPEQAQHYRAMLEAIEPEMAKADKPAMR